MRQSFPNFVLKKVFQKNFVSRVALRSIDMQFIRKYFGNEFLAPIQAFALDGYDTLLYKDLNLDCDGVIVVLGGFLGDSSEMYVRSTWCEIHIFEPVAEFFNALEARFVTNRRIHLHNYAVSGATTSIELSINGERSGVFEPGSDKIRVASRDIFDIVTELKSIELLELNIEGGEYEILERLLDGERVARIKILQIQFHNLSGDHDFKRAKIRLELSKTHEQVFNYDWVWERWIRKHVEPNMDTS